MWRDQTKLKEPYNIRCSTIGHSAAPGKRHRTNDHTTTYQKNTKQWGVGSVKVPATGGNFLFFAASETGQASVGNGLQSARTHGQAGSGVVIRRVDVHAANALPCCLRRKKNA